MTTLTLCPVGTVAEAVPDKAPATAEAMYEPAGIGSSVQTFSVRSVNVAENGVLLSGAFLTVTVILLGSKFGSSSTMTCTSRIELSLGGGGGGGGGGTTACGVGAGVYSTSEMFHSHR